MYIKMTNTKYNYEAWYRKQGIYAFDFVTDKKYASALTEEECERIMKSADWYVKMFGEGRLEIERTKYYVAKKIWNDDEMKWTDDVTLFDEYEEARLDFINIPAGYRIPVAMFGECQLDKGGQILSMKEILRKG